VPVRKVEGKKVKNKPSVLVAAPNAASSTVQVKRLISAATVAQPLPVESDKIAEPVLKVVSTTVDVVAPVAAEPLQSVLVVPVSEEEPQLVFTQESVETVVAAQPDIKLNTKDNVLLVGSQSIKSDTELVASLIEEIRQLTADHRSIEADA
jgi:hypothetical protein